MGRDAVQPTSAPSPPPQPPRGPPGASGGAPETWPGRRKLGRAGAGPRRPRRLPGPPRGRGERLSAGGETEARGSVCSVGTDTLPLPFAPRVAPAQRQDSGRLGKPSQSKRKQTWDLNPPGSPACLKSRVGMGSAVLALSDSCKEPSAVPGSRKLTGLGRSAKKRYKAVPTALCLYKTRCLKEPFLISSKHTHRSTYSL